MAAAPHPDVLDAAVLTLVLARHPAPVHRDDLARALAQDDWPSSVAALVVDGLLHEAGELYVVSRAAVRFEELLG